MNDCIVQVETYPDGDRYLSAGYPAYIVPIEDGDFSSFVVVVSNDALFQPLLEMGGEEQEQRGIYQVVTFVGTIDDVFEGSTIEIVESWEVEVEIL